MPEYCFFKKGKQTVVLKKSDVEGVSELTAMGYEKQFEEVIATDETHALTRFADIRKQQQIDNHNFLAGAGTMPIIDVLTTVATSLIRDK
ncbi:hypothetical protein [Buttiauxella sp.]|uniref:hypothetical protein n=1 Tax=Buttiauxella sp. TaxID=1972222 RepID=UPI003C78E3F9